MADITDITTALVTLVASTVYPGGTGQPSVSGAGIKVYEGWPTPLQLDTDIAAGLSHISIFPQPGDTPTTRYLNDGEEVVSISTPKIAAVVDGQSVRLSGSVPAADDPHAVVLMVNGLPYAYAVHPTYTLDGVASGLASLIAADVPGTIATGPTIAIPAPARIGMPRVAVSGSYARATRSQRSVIRISVWSPNPEQRRAIASAVDAALSDVRFLALPDQKARLLYSATVQLDAGERDRVYRRDLLYSVDYRTTIVRQSTTIACETTTTRLDT